MPYIKPIAREYFDNVLKALQHTTISNPGELNYMFTELVKHYLASHTNNYQTYNDIIGALECCQFELYRRRIAFYEDEKIEENTDVY